MPTVPSGQAFCTGSCTPCHQPRGTKVRDISAEISVVLSPCLLDCSHSEAHTCPTVANSVPVRPRGCPPAPQLAKLDLQKACFHGRPCPQSPTVWVASVSLGACRPSCACSLGPTGSTNSVVGSSAECCATLSPAGDGGCPRPHATRHYFAGGTTHRR